VKSSRLSYLLIVGALGCIEASFAQNTNVEVRTVLDLTEQKFGVTFTYMDQTIDSLVVSTPDSTFTLQQILNFLEEETKLNFIALKNGYISVRLLKEPDRVCGYLLDKESELPISDVLITSGEHATTTDSLGYFELTKGIGLTEIIIRHVNYETVSIKLDQGKSACSTYYLTSNTIRLEEIIVQNYVTRGIDKKTDGSINIDVQNTDILPGLTEPDVLYSIQILPGILSSDETVTDINIRGGSHDQNLVIWDGVRMYQTGHFFGLISAMNSHIIHKATLIKNGTSAAYGEGVSGTIMTETRDRKAIDTSIEAGSSLINSDILVETPFGKKSSLLVASRQSLNGLLVTPTFNQYFDRAFRGTDVINDPMTSSVVNSDERFRFYDVAAKLHHDFSDSDHLKLGFLAAENSIQYQESAPIDGRQVKKISRLDQHSLMGYLTYERLWNDRFKTILFGSSSNFSQESVNYNVLTDQKHELDNEVLETALKVDGIYYINDKVDLTAGVQYQETGIRNFRQVNKPSFRSLEKNVLRTSSLFLEANSEPVLGSHLRLGLRANYFHQFDRLRIEPRLSFSQELGSHLSMELSAELKSQTTIQAIDFQTDFLGVENRKWELVNEEDIPLITSSQASIGFNYQKKNLLMSLEGFSKNIDGIITSSQGFLNQFQFVRSSGSSTSQGVELLVNPKFGFLDTWLTYSYLNSQYTVPQLIPQKFRNNFDITHSLSLGVSYLLNKLELSSGANFRTGIPFTNSLGYDQNREEIIYGPPNSLTLDNYFRLDFSVKYHFTISNKLQSDVGLAIWNLTNRDNVINSFYQYENEEVQRVNRTALGITPNLSLRIYYSPGK
jgi:outer membrane cobalamin receptor